MLEIIALWFLCRHIGTMALNKGLKPSTWKLYAILAWFGGELLGFIIGVYLFGAGDLLGLILFALISAVGGYLLIYTRVKKMPDIPFDDINNIGL